MKFKGNMGYNNHKEIRKMKKEEEEGEMGFIKKKGPCSTSRPERPYCGPPAFSSLVTVAPLFG